MSIINETRGDFEIKSVIEEMYCTRADEIINMHENITLKELSKFPQDIKIELMEKLSEIEQETSNSNKKINEDELYKRFYSTRI